MAEGNSEGLNKVPKITNHGDDDVASFKAIDRLSDLHDNILHHILSFLDTKSLFRTSVLSRRWGGMWKEVPVLNFSCDDFKSRSSFEKHVLKFLSLRSGDSAAVSSVTIKAWSWRGTDKDAMHYTELFDRVLKHAASHGPRGSLHQLSMSHCRDLSYNFGDVVPSIKAHHHHQSLKTLNLKWWDLECGGGSGAALFSGFNLLTNLELERCNLFSSGSMESPVEPFVGLPCLKHLKLVDCNSWSSSRLLKVSGSELLDLQIQNPVATSQKVTVFAPKLKSFCFWGCLEQIIQLNLPSLDHANIRVRIKLQEEIEATNRACLELLPQLHNVESLNLCFDKTTKKSQRQQYEFPLISGTALSGELKVPPFTRLEMLRVWYPYAPPAVPQQVIHYFTEGSHHSVQKSFKFEKKPR